MNCNFQLCNHPSLVVNDDPSSNNQDRRGGRAKKKICYAEEEKSSAAPGADVSPRRRLMFLTKYCINDFDFLLVHPYWLSMPHSQGIARYMPLEAMGGGPNSRVMPELSGKMFVLWRLMRQMRMPGNGADVRFVIITVVVLWSEPSLTHLFTSYLSCIAENRDSVQLYPDAGSNWADVQRE